MNAVFSHASDAPQASAAQASANPSPQLNQAILAALASRWPGDILLSYAEALAELAAEVAMASALAPGGGADQVAKLHLLAETARQAAQRFGRAPVPVLALPANNPLPFGLPTTPPFPPAMGCQAISVAQVVRSLHGVLVEKLGASTADDAVRMADLVADSGSLWRQLHPAELAIAADSLGLGTRVLEAMIAAVHESAWAHDARGSNVLHALNQALDCLR
jgi:hypothetical protein